MPSQVVAAPPETTSAIRVRVIEPTTTAPADAPPPADRPWRRAGIIGGATWLGAASTYVLITMLSAMIQERPGPPLSQLYQTWNHWDTGYYMNIARSGYPVDRLDFHAFFPLYPMLLRAVDFVVPGPTLVATLVLANLSCLGALTVLHRFVAREFGSTVADRALLYLMAFPTAFFLSAGYNASLFLLLMVSALYCLRSGSFWAAGLLGALASATRLTGVLLVLPFALEYGRQHAWRVDWRPRPRLRPGALRWDAAAVLLIPVGVGAFAIFCWVRFGDPLEFIHAQQNWGRHFALPWDTFGEALQKVTAEPRLLNQAAVHNLIDIGFALAAITMLVLCVVGPWRLQRDQLFLVVYSGAALMTVLVGPNGGAFPMMSVPRYALELVPAFILLARFGASRVFDRLYLLPAVGLQAVFLLTFLRNVWIA